MITDQKKISQNFSRQFFFVSKSLETIQETQTSKKSRHYWWSCNQLLVSKDVLLMRILEIKKNLEKRCPQKPRVELCCWTCNQLLVLTRVCMHITCMSTDSLIMSRLYVREHVKSLSKSSKMGYFNWTKHSILKKIPHFYSFELCIKIICCIFEIKNYTLENLFAVNF